jgi:hypothetical protein
MPVWNRRNVGEPAEQCVRALTEVLGDLDCLAAARAALAEDFAQLRQAQDAGLQTARAAGIGAEGAVIPAGIDARKVVVLPERIPAKYQSVGSKNHRPACQCLFCIRIRWNTYKGDEGKAKGVKGVREAKTKRIRKAYLQAVTSPDSPTYADKRASIRAVLPDKSDATQYRTLKAIESSADVRARILGADERAGITDDFLAQKRRELIEAKETVFYSHLGLVTDEREVEAYGIQVKALELAHKVRGELANVEQVQGAALIINVGETVDEENWETLASVELSRQAAGRIEAGAAEVGAEQRNEKPTQR